MLGKHGQLAVVKEQPLHISDPYYVLQNWLLLMGG